MLACWRSCVGGERREVAVSVGVGSSIAVGVYVHMQNISIRIQSHTSCVQLLAGAQIQNLLIRNLLTHCTTVALALFS